MQIFIKFYLLGRTYTLDVEPTDTIYFLKTKFSELSGRPMEKIDLGDWGLFLYRYGKKIRLLENDKTLKDYEIGKECIIYYECILRGGDVSIF